MRGFHPKLTRAELISTDDSGPEQKVEAYGLAGEKLSELHRPQPFGLSAHAPPQSTALIMSLGGERSISILMGGELPSKRPNNLPEGTSVLYDASGNVIFAKAANGLQIKSNTSHVTVEVPAGKNVYVGGDGSGGGWKRVMLEGGALSKNVYGLPV